MIERFGAVKSRVKSSGNAMSRAAAFYASLA